MSSPVRILAIDGGGVRGYIPALVLAEIERRAGRPASSLFDLVVGTSTGGIIGIGLCVGRSAQELADFYPSYGRKIFGGSDRPVWKKRLLGSGENLGESLDIAARTVGSPFGGNPAFGGNARHPATGLEAALREVLGEVRLSESALELAVTSFDGQSAQPVIFSRRDAAANPAFDLPLRDVARATSAAPTYFPPHDLVWAGSQRSFVDGGVWANNPTGVALAESVALTSARSVTGSSVFLVSLGTGVAASGEIFRGTDTWIGSAGDIVKTATSVSAGEALMTRALPPSNYRRLQVVDDRVAGAMDDPSPERLSALNGAAAGLIAASSADIDLIAATLSSGT